MDFSNLMNFYVEMALNLCLDHCVLASRSDGLQMYKSFLELFVNIFFFWIYLSQSYFSCYHLHRWLSQKPLHLFCHNTAIVLLIPLRNSKRIGGKKKKKGSYNMPWYWSYTGVHTGLAFAWISDGVCELKVWLVKPDETNLQECFSMEICSDTGPDCFCD